MNRQSTIRIRFEKDGPARYLSHLDTQRAFHRAFRRALLPVAYTSGKQQRAKLSVIHPLPVGVTSAVELLDVDLAIPLALSNVERRLARVLPEGCRVVSLRIVPAGERRKLVGLQYEISGVTVPENRIQARLASSAWTIARTRNEKTQDLDIRPLIDDITVDGDRLAMHLRVTDGPSIRPDEVLAALGVTEDAIADCRIERTALIERTPAPPAAHGGRRRSSAPRRAADRRSKRSVEKKRGRRNAEATHADAREAEARRMTHPRSSGASTSVRTPRSDSGRPSTAARGSENIDRVLEAPTHGNKKEKGRGGNGDHRERSRGPEHVVQANQDGEPQQDRDQKA